MPSSSKPEAPTHPASIRVGYLLSRYPAVSHTFFLKEIVGLRERGIVAEVASVNPPDRPRNDLPPQEESEACGTFYVKPANRVVGALRVLLIALRNPRAALRGLAAALKLGGWDLKSKIFAVFYLAEALLVGNWLRRRSLQHLHVHFGGAVASVGMLTSCAWNIPWSLTLHGPDEFFNQEEFFLRQKIESARFVICISDFCRSQVLRISPRLNEDRLETVRLGVDCQALQPSATKSHGLPFIEGHTETPLRLVCTGRMVPAKAHRVLLQALALLRKSGVHFVCTLIGDGPERPFLVETAAELGIADDVQFLGAMAHEPTLIEVSKADVFALASFAEGLPVALMEAMALGVPCVSTTIAGIPELVDHMENGLLVPAANANALFEALHRLAVDSELRLRLGRKARATIEERYNLVCNLDLLANVLSKRFSDVESGPK